MLSSGGGACLSSRFSCFACWSGLLCLALPLQAICSASRFLFSELEVVTWTRDFLRGCLFKGISDDESTTPSSHRPPIPRMSPQIIARDDQLWSIFILKHEALPNKHCWSERKKSRQRIAAALLNLFYSKIHQKLQSVYKSWTKMHICSYQSNIDNPLMNVSNLGKLNEACKNKARVMPKGFSLVIGSSAQRDRGKTKFQLFFQLKTCFGREFEVIFGGAGASIRLSAHTTSRSLCSLNI